MEKVEKLVAVCWKRWALTLAKTITINMQNLQHQREWGSWVLDKCTHFNAFL